MNFDINRKKIGSLYTQTLLLYFFKFSRHEENFYNKNEPF